MANNSDDGYVKIKKEELDELNSKIQEQEVILSQTKEYMFGLHNSNLNKDNEIKMLKKDNDKLKEKNEKLNKEVKQYNSSTSWKITKPLRVLTGAFRK